MIRGDRRVRDVAAQLTIAARHSREQVVREMVRARGNGNRMIHDAAVREGALPVAGIAANLRSIVGSRRLAPTTSPREPLLDLLVHGQDIALALGRTRRMPPAAARDAADRVWTMRVPPRPDQLLAPLSPAERDQFVLLLTHLLDHHNRGS